MLGVHQIHIDLQSRRRLQAMLLSCARQDPLELARRKYTLIGQKVLRMQLIRN